MESSEIFQDPMIKRAAIDVIIFNTRKGEGE